jgi:hypothetical protein
MIQDYYKPISLYRRTESQNSYGATSYSTELNLISTGLINGHSKGESDIADKYQVAEVFNFYTDVGQDILQDDIVEFEGLKYKIISNAKDTTRQGHHWKFLALRVDSDV